VLEVTDHFELTIGRLKQELQDDLEAAKVEAASKSF
jgi:hypothetical protein